jgi:hypothetical protein
MMATMHNSTLQPQDDIDGRSIISSSDMTTKQSNHCRENVGAGKVCCKIPLDFRLFQVEKRWKNFSFHRFPTSKIWISPHGIILKSPPQKKNK